MAESKSTRLAAIVLAAGLGTRFGGGKLTAPFRGRPLIAGALDTALATPVSSLIVAVGDDPVLEAAIRPLAPTALLVRISDPAQGLGASLAAAARAVPADTDGVFVFLGDMPLIGREVAPALARALNRPDGVVAPVHDGKRGHPVLFGGAWISDLCALTGDVGAQALIRQAGDRLRLVETDDAGVLFDIDRPEDLEAG